MPKFIAHAFTGATIVAAIHPTAGLANPLPLVVGALLAMSADLDFLIEWGLKIPDFHRGPTHSLAFSMLIGLLSFYFAGKTEQRAAIAFSLAYLSHILLDFAASTSGGVKLFYPFSDKYFNLGLTGIFEIPFYKGLTNVIHWFAIETIVFLPIFLFVIWLKYAHD